MQFERLRRREDFVALRRGLVARDELFTVQVSREARADETVRAGFTVTKKVGDAVERNRIKRRLRHAVRDVAAWPDGLAGRDVAVIARRAVLDAPYGRLLDRLSRTVAKALQRAGKSSDAPPQGAASP